MHMSFTNAHRVCLLFSRAFKMIICFRSSFLVFIFAYNYVNTFSLMLGSLSIYFILMFDYLTLRGWTSLDDVMFYIRGACRAIEFCVTLGICGYIMTTFYAEMTSFLGKYFNNHLSSHVRNLPFRTKKL